MSEKKLTTVEVEAITIADAIKKALKTLKAREEDVTIKVLKEECKGLFGMEGARRARIKVTIKSPK